MTRVFDPAGGWIEAVASMRASEGALRVQLDGPDGTTEYGLELYRGEYVLAVGDEYGTPGSVRANFVRGADGQVAWFSSGGRLYEHRG